MPLISGPKGAPDVLPPEAERQQWLIREASETFRLYGYRLIKTPIFESTELFERGLEKESDIVTKEMYTFQDKGGRSLTLRPDMTAPVMRAVLEHGLHKAALPVKLFYAGPLFRHERPQSGRYRQFRQLGVEAVGSAGPVIDAEVVELAARVLSRLGLASNTLKLNSIGHSECRANYLPQLVEFLERHSEQLCEDCRRKIQTNPLRTFDCKQSRDRRVMQDAPVIADHLCAECKEHYESVKLLLEAAGVTFEEDPRLVRGLDYYTRTAFEFVTEGLGAQNAVAAGGRYDGLAEQLGSGDPLPGIGFGLGLERVALALDARDTPAAPPVDNSLDVFVVSVGQAPGQAVFRLVTELRRAGVRADIDHAFRSTKGQFKAADRAGARWTVVIGERELDSGTFTLKDMQSGEERPMDLEGVMATLSHGRGGNG